MDACAVAGYTCVKCDDRENANSDLKIHFALIHVKKLFSCHKCDDILKSEEQNGPIVKDELIVANYHKKA